MSQSAETYCSAVRRRNNGEIQNKIHKHHEFDEI